MPQNVIPHPAGHAREPPTSQGSGHPAEAWVEVVRVVKRYGATVALDGVSLRIARGETLGLLGPNGAGKTSLMLALCGLLRPDSGRIRLGRCGDPADGETRRQIGLAPQSLALYQGLTAAENLRFFARVHGVPAKELHARVRRGLQLADLTARAEDRAGTLSGGMQRRLNLACSLLHEPRLLLLDEPTAGVDAQSRQHVTDAIARLRAQGMTVVLSTHLLDEAARLCDRVAVLDRGRLHELCSPAELCKRHGVSDLQGALLAVTGRELRD